MLNVWNGMRISISATLQQNIKAEHIAHTLGTQPDQASFYLWPLFSEEQYCPLGGNLKQIEKQLTN